MSNTNERINVFYGGLLQDVNIVNGGDDRLSVAIKGALEPVLVEGRRLTLPTRDRLKEDSSQDRIFFHPLSEHVNRGPSPVFNALKGYIHYSLTEKFKTIAVELMELAVTKERHKKLKSKQSHFLKDLAEADATTLKALVKVVEAMGLNTDRRLMTLYVKNGGLSSDDKSLRSCVVSFPLLDEATNPDTTELYGVKMPRKTKDKALILALFGHILADEERRALFSSGSVDLEAPYLHALLTSFYKLATWINTLCQLYESACPTLGEIQYKLDWVEDLENFALFRNVIPSLDGNTGVSLDKDKSEEEAPRERSRMASTVFSPPITEPRTELDRLMTDDDDRRSSRDSRRDEPLREGDVGLDDYLNRKSRSSLSSRRDDRDRDRDDRYGRDRDRDDRGSRFGGGRRGRSSY